MVIRKILAAILIAGSALIAGCSNTVDSGGVTAIDNGIMPLHIGNSWTYERSVRDNPNDPFTIDTITVRINRYPMRDHEIWYEPYGYPWRELWTNRGDEFWVWPYSDAPYKFANHRLMYSDTWAGPSDECGVFLLYNAGYYDIPAKGAFLYDYIFTCSGEPDNMRSTYRFVPHLGIADVRIETSLPTGSSFVSQTLRLTDYALPDPPDGSHGEIAFRYYIDRSNLLPPYSFKVELSLSNPPFGIIWYGVNPDGQPEIPVGGYSPLQVIRQYQTVQDAVIQNVPCGIHTLTVALWRMDGFSQLSSVTIDSISVENGQSTDLGLINAFLPPAP
ncbi:MAG: hypothetical protein PHR28_09960 [candidate division Zixibacteria bacterium]|nr:hypothetical protein [candidate division Zixibacteria bacterium]